MAFSIRSAYATPRPDLGGLLARDVASLLIMSHLISRSLHAVRPECEFSRELTAGLDAIVTICDAGESHLHRPLVESGTVLPPVIDATAGALVSGFFTRLPAAATPRMLAAEVAINLRLLAQYVELKARLAAEEALLVGQNHLSQALAAWSIEWRACGQLLRSAWDGTQAPARAADLPTGAFAAVN